MAELTEHFQVHPIKITNWKRQLLARAADAFGHDVRPPSDTPDLETLYGKIGQLALVNDFFEGVLTKAGILSAKR